MHRSFVPDTRNMGGRHEVMTEHAIHMLKLAHIRRPRSPRQADGTTPRPPLSAGPNGNRPSTSQTARRLRFKDASRDGRKSQLGKVSQYHNFIEQVGV